MTKWRNPYTGQVDDVAEALAYHYRSHGWEEVIEDAPEPEPEIGKWIPEIDAEKPVGRGKHAAS